ncbi:MAG: hypothetical protein D4R44_02055 [Actinobacteria bacterium]|nr:MAG: hypothetical protein D4R44_02055 [Actinomycetota bacterium]
MRLEKSLYLILFFLLLLSSPLRAEELLTDQGLLSEPKAQVSVTGHAKKGKITVLEKKGFWIKVKAGNVSGWTKLSNVKADSTSRGLGLGDINTGRSASGNIVATSGVRGLDGGDLKNAQPDFKEFDRLVAQKVTREQAVDFAKQAGLTTKKLSYVTP